MYKLRVGICYYYYYYYYVVELSKTEIKMSKATARVKCLCIRNPTHD